MTGPSDGTPPGHDPTSGARPTDPAGEEVGSVGEEAAKLLGALSDWAKESTVGGAGGGVAAGLSGLAGHAASAFAEVDAHLATGAAECTYCPICRTVHVIRATSPEVKAHLTSAASSLLQALAGALATLPPPPGSGGSSGGSSGGAGVERIDLDEPDDLDHDPGEDPR